MNLEPELDSYNPRQAMKALEAAELVVMITAYKSHAILQGDYADVLLPGRAIHRNIRYIHQYRGPGAKL